jgi:hypothetical protein
VRLRSLCIDFFPFVVSLSNHSWPLSKQAPADEPCDWLGANGLVP